MNICHSDTNTTLDDSNVLSTGSLAFTIQMIIGFAMVLINIILVLGFTKERQYTKTTVIFLSNLAVSDILFGFLAVLRLIAIATASDYTQMICRGTVGGTVLSASMSLICILLISVQV